MADLIHSFGVAGVDRGKAVACSVAAGRSPVTSRFTRRLMRMANGPDLDSGNMAPGNSPVPPAKRTAEQDGLPAPRRYLAVTTLMLAVALSSLDAAIVAVALPSIARALQITGSDAVWVVTAYQIAIVGSLFPFAAAGEIVGFRRVFTLGMVVFAVASVACLFADGLLALAVARALQGLGGAAILSMTPALLRVAQPQRLLGRTFGLMATIVALSSAIAPTLGAAIIALADWTWIFAINIPLCVLALATAASLPGRTGEARPFDWRSAALNALAFGLLILGVDRLAEAPLAGSICLAGAIVAGALLLKRERRRTVPIVPVDLLRIRSFAFSVAGSVCLFAAQMCGFVSLPFLLQGSLGRSEIETGLLMTAWPSALGLVAPVTGWLSDRVSAAPLCGAGGLAMGLALAGLAFWPADLPVAAMVVLLVVSGAGFALFQTPNNRMMLLSTPKSRSGAAGGSLATARQFGQALGAVLVALCLTISAATGPRAALVLSALLALAAATIGWRRPPLSS